MIGSASSSLDPAFGRPAGWLVPARRDGPELLDRPDQHPDALAANLRDIRRFNELGGGITPILRHLPLLLDQVPAGQEATILDLATGSADIPLAIARWARRRERSVRIIASDVSAEILDHAAAQIATDPAIRLERYDALAVPLSMSSVDVTLASLTLHHFAPDSAMRLLQEMDRLSRIGWIVNDLRRHRLSYMLAWLSTRIATRNALTRHDAPLSVLRAYTPEELRALVRLAEIDGVRVHEHAWWRMAAVKGSDT